MRQETHIASFKPEAAIPGNTIVMMGTVDFNVVQATAGLGIGVSNSQGAPTGDEDNCDVVLSGIAEVILGGTVALGAAVMADANGQGVAATGSPITVIGTALEGGVAGDIRSVFLMQHTK